MDTFDEKVRDAVRSYLRDSLRIDVHKRASGYGSYSNDVDIVVDLYLDGELFSSASVSVAEGDHGSANW